MIGVTALSGCAMMGDGIPPEKLGEYAQVASRIGLRGSNMDTLPDSRRGFENTANISWINGKSIFPAREALNMLPGEYEFQVGIGCDNTATCRPGKPYKLVVKAGMRYVLTPNAVYVSDRYVPRNKAVEAVYGQ
ncbi:MAG: hypothetical protein Q7U91_10615 [Sideroxyarcus sp.]|nr:hypothetical protein [Sideroxyarcus sp.]